MKSLTNSGYGENVLNTFGRAPTVVDPLADPSRGQGRNLETDRFFSQNKQWALPSSSYVTSLSPDQEEQFKKWVSDAGIPFDPSPQSDYDMRGFWADLVGGGGRAPKDFKKSDGSFSFPDYFTTPYSQTFSNESRWATPGAPTWNEKDQLVDRKGNIIFDGGTN